MGWRAEGGGSIVFNPRKIMEACDAASLFARGHRLRPRDNPREVMSTILRDMGFSGHVDGMIIYVATYDGKLSNDEDKFFATLAPFIGDGGEFYWEDSEGTQWQWEFEDGRMYSRDVICTAGEREEVTA